ncbi:MAG: amidinotransferase [Bacteroidetes bacterium]|nr:MAG: amidinotransferase [Bacteroidota bacterium]
MKKTAKTNRQTTAHIFMVRPAHFGFNPETAINNAFQTNDQRYSITEISEAAKYEFDLFVQTLRKEGVNVLVGEDTRYPVKPDAVFPNNWVTFHEDGTIVTYPMFAPTRRVERSEAMIRLIKSKFQSKRRVHLEHYEDQGLFLEGTGSIVFDHPNRLAYACISPRTSPVLLDICCELIDYQPITFHSTDKTGQQIYHTNVMMAMGETFVVICLESITDEKERAGLIEWFRKTGKDIVDISLEQVSAYAGNMLQIRNLKNERLLVMSEQAYRSLTPAQLEQIQTHTEILYSPISTIETYGGGSARCMMAEIFLPKK